MKISNLPEDTAPTTDDYVAGVDATPTITKRYLLSRLITLFFANVPSGTSITSLVKKLWGGWVTASGTWSYLTSSTISVPSADIALMSVGTKIWITQTTDKFFYVTAISGTTLTVNSPNGSSVSSADITAAYYSNESTPDGYPTTGEYIEIGRTTLTGTSDTITVSGLPAMKYIKIYATLIPSGAINARLQFNNDTAANYGRRVSDAGGADTTAVSATSVTLMSDSNAVLKYLFIECINIAAQEKILSFYSGGLSTAGAGTAPSRSEGFGKWANTSAQISRVDIANSAAGDYASGSEVIVYGRN